MTIKVGDKVPSATLMQFKDGGPKPVKTDEYFAGKVQRNNVVVMPEPAKARPVYPPLRKSA